MKHKTIYTTFFAVLLAGVFATGTASAEASSKYDNGGRYIGGFLVGISQHDPVHSALKGRVKMSCWKERGNRADWTQDVPTLFGSKYKIRKCPGRVTIALDPDHNRGNAKWERIKILEPCKQGKKPRRVATISYEGDIDSKGGNANMARLNLRDFKVHSRCQVQL